MKELHAMRCVACEGNKLLTPEEIGSYLTQVPEWKLNAEKTIITRRFSFKNFYQTMAFVNAIAWLAHQENHHPDLEIGYNYCNIKYSTHAVSGLSVNDFISAAKIDLLGP
jgi:4a-hydroxytetrahydrobiopterin dehydratase